MVDLNTNCSYIIHNFINHQFILFLPELLKYFTCIIINNLPMTSNNSYSLHKRRYAQISIKKRKALVDLVVQGGKSLSEAGRKLHINPSTVRLIVKKYNETGIFFNKRLRNTPKEVTPSHIEEKSQENLVKIQEGQEILKKQQKAIPGEREARIKVQTDNRCPSRPQYPFLYYGYIY